MPSLHGIRLHSFQTLQFHYVKRCWVFNFSKTCAHGIHSGQQCEHKMLARPTHRKTAACKKNSSMGKEPRTYMRDIVTNISKILRYSAWDSAREQLEKLPVRWDSYTVNQTLKTHPPMEKAWLFFSWAAGLRRFKHDQFTYTTMLDIFGEAGRISSMQFVYEKMKENGIKIDVVTYTSLLHWLSKAGDFEGSTRIWEEMRARGLNPTVVSYTAFMKVLFDNGRPVEAGKLYKEMIESGCFPNCYTYTVLIEHLAGAGKFEAALQIMTKMQEAGVQPDKAMCNIFIEKCSQAGQMVAMAQILQYMKDNKLVLRYPIYLKALEALRTAGQCVKLLQEVNPHLVAECADDDSDESSATMTDIMDKVLILTLLGRGNFVAVDHMLHELSSKTNSNLGPKLIMTTIEANCANNRLSSALLAFQYSVRIGVRLEKSTYLTLIGHLMRSKLFQRAVEIAIEMVNAGISMGSFFPSLLIYKLGCARLPDLATRIFESLLDGKDVATYTTLIYANIQSGNIDKGLELYSMMTERGILPLYATYTVLILGLRSSDRTYQLEAFRKKQKAAQRSYYTKDSTCSREHFCSLLYDMKSSL